MQNKPLQIDRQGQELHIRIPADLRRAECMPAVEEALKAFTPKPAKVRCDIADISQRDTCAIAAAVEINRACEKDDVEFITDNADPVAAELIQRLTSMSGVEPTRGLSAIALPEQVGEHAMRFGNNLRMILEFTGELYVSLYRAVLHPAKVRWREVLVYMDRCGTGGVPIVLLICFLMGLILGFQAALQLQVFGAEIYVANLVGLSVCRSLGPLMVAMIATGRAGSAFAAEIGTMKVSEEVDALVTMGLEPGRFLVVPKVIALIAVMPLLTIIGDVAGVAGGFVVGHFHLDITLVAYWNQTVNALGVWDIMLGLIKSVVFAFFIAAVGCLRGLQTRGGAQGVGGSTTSAVVSGIFCIIVSDAVMTIIFARFGLG